VVLLIVEIVCFRDALSGLFTLSSLVVVLELLFFILLWFKWPLFKRILGEGRGEKRPGSRILFITLTFVIILLPLSLYILKSLSPEQVPTVANISIVVLGLSLAGLSLRAASIGTNVDERMRFVCISQKFILVVILFVIFIPLIYLIDLPPFNGIYVDSIVWPPDTISVLRGLLFWIATPCYYLGIFLLWLGMNDFIVVLANLSITSDTSTDTKSSTIASVKPELRKNSSSSRHNR